MPETSVPIQLPSIVAPCPGPEGDPTWIPCPAPPITLPRTTAPGVFEPSGMSESVGPPISAATAAFVPMRFPWTMASRLPFCTATLNCEWPAMRLRSAGAGPPTRKSSLPLT